MSAAKTPPQNPVKPADRAQFHACLGRWQERLGLADWRVHLSSKPSPHQADVTIMHGDRLATIRLGKSFGDAAVTPESIEHTAVHELAHVLLCELRHQTEYDIRADALDSAEHRVVQTIVRLALAAGKP